MRYTIEGFSQEYAMTLKKTVPVKDKEKTIQIDCTDLVILRWFVDFYPNMKKITVDGKEYAWLTHKKLLTDLPLLDITKRACIERMQKLVEFGILDYKLLKDGGTFSLYSFGPNYINLVRSNDTGEAQSNSTGGMRSNGIGGDGQPDNKDSSISDPSIKHSSIKNKRGKKQFIPPTLEEVENYCKERNNNVDAKKFFDYFAAADWIDSKGNPVRNWKQKVITWESYASNGKQERNGNDGKNTGDSSKAKYGRYI